MAVLAQLVWECNAFQYFPEKTEKARIYYLTELATTWLAMDLLNRMMAIGWPTKGLLRYDKTP